VAIVARIALDRAQVRVVANSSHDHPGCGTSRPPAFERPASRAGKRGNAQGSAFRPLINGKVGRRRMNGCSGAIEAVLSIAVLG
jgi:hypothetical protein